MNQLAELLTKAFHQNASDIHLTVGSVPIFRIDGRLVPYKSNVIQPEDTKEMARSIVSDKLWERLEQEREIDLSHGIAGVSRFRVNIFYQRNNLSLAIRVIPIAIPSLEELELPEVLKK
ncbi:twitching motility protein PilT [Gracilibacillus boraciitolerans JCM 21714]|uniref:Twitching motility protein PilT n=1 Tax=Gracilibacillus boraciitolerans JCM 21714 TaxID=1298598 RepID=W4VII1_9BACI|nr:twitching motility protein PilT [Gracilibacillus boraciitolerans JCM 21714]